MNEIAERAPAAEQLLQRAYRKGYLDGYADRSMLQGDAGAVAGFTKAADRVGRVYLSGPMTGMPNNNVAAFHAAAKLLREKGFTVVNPAELGDEKGQIDGAAWEDYLRYDIARLVECELIALLPGWRKSRGALLEFNIAQSLGIGFMPLDGAELPCL